MTIRLSVFLLVSCLAHTGLLWWQRPALTPVVNIGGEARALRVSLAAAEVPAATAGEDKPQPQAPGTPDPQRAVAPRPAPAAETAPQPAAASRATPPQVAPAPAPRPPADAVRSEPASTQLAAGGGSHADAAPNEPQTSSIHLSKRVSAALQSQLAEAFQYPWLARRRGWQGMVTLSLHVDEDGSLTRWKVLQTSGYSVLDRSALKAARSIRRLHRAEQLLNGQSLNLAIPVRYRLLDS